MKLTNQSIYTYALNLYEKFSDGEQKFPIKINFYLQKNKKLLAELASDIEQSRDEIIAEYGKLNENGNGYIIPEEHLESAQKEINDLLSLEQDVNIYMVNINSFPDDMNLTSEQMEALMFMIEE